VWGLLALAPPPGRDCRPIFDLSGCEQPTWKLWAGAPLPPPREGGGDLAVRADAADETAGKDKKDKDKKVLNPPVLTPPSIPGTFALAPAAEVTNLIQVVFLPDFEEQYAVKNTNVLAQAKYEYSFANGCTLAEAGGSYNATVVPVAILQTIQKAIGAAGELQKQALESLPIPAPPQGPRAEVDPSKIYYVVRQTFIEPGVYRLQKSWEVQAAEAEGHVEPCRAGGLLTEMGLPVEECALVLTREQYTAAFADLAPRVRN
jgi:hypothetical protein